MTSLIPQYLLELEPLLFFERTGDGSTAWLETQL